MFVSCVCMLSCVGRGLCDGLITRPEESYHVSCVCDHRNPERGPMFDVGNYRKMNELNQCISKENTTKVLLSFVICAKLLISEYVTANVCGFKKACYGVGSCAPD
jgi:hypothetical protein